MMENYSVCHMLDVLILWTKDITVMSITMEILLRRWNVIPLLACIDIPNRLAFKTKVFIFGRFFPKIVMLPLKNLKKLKKIFFFKNNKVVLGTVTIDYQHHKTVVLASV